jgi:hypothetical protein
MKKLFIAMITIAFISVVSGTTSASPPGVKTNYDISKDLPGMATLMTECKSIQLETAILIPAEKGQNIIIIPANFPEVMCRSGVLYDHSMFFYTTYNSPKFNRCQLKTIFYNDKSPVYSWCNGIVA